jgi:hypothetical protein
VRSSIRMAIAIFMGCTAYFAAAFLLGIRPDALGDWIRLLVRAALIVSVVVMTVEWVGARRIRSES